MPTRAGCSPALTLTGLSLNFAVMDTREEYRRVVAACRDVFEKKLHDYGPSWRVMRPSSVTDQLFIKAKRIRTLEEAGGRGMVDEGIAAEYTAIVNYSAVAVIQMRRQWVDRPDIGSEEALAAYDRITAEALELMTAKNHDYGEAWRDMRTTSLTDIILTKILRNKEIEDLGGATLVSEGADSNCLDMLVYAVFALIRLGVK